MAVFFLLVGTRVSEQHGSSTGAARATINRRSCSHGCIFALTGWGPSFHLRLMYSTITAPPAYTSCFGRVPPSGTHAHTYRQCFLVPCVHAVVWAVPSSPASWGPNFWRVGPCNDRFLSCQGPGSRVPSAHPRPRCARHEYAQQREHARGRGRGVDARWAGAHRVQSTRESKESVLFVFRI